jgi:pseudouridine synthase
MERLNRFLARSGIASRRASDRLILTGKVRVNGLPVARTGIRIDPLRDRVDFDGKRVEPPKAFTTTVLNKPPGFLVSSHDPHHAKTVFSLLPGLPRLFSVGRLDLDTAGVLLLTDDGELCHRLIHPRYGVRKTYQVKVQGIPSEDALAQLRRGVTLSDGVTAPSEVELLEPDRPDAVLVLSLGEGRKRQVKRMCNAIGHPVERLERIAFAGITAEGLEAGAWRYLTATEIALLRERVGL